MRRQTTFVYYRYAEFPQIPVVHMEPAWEKTTGLQFELCEKTYQMANGVRKRQPYYSLTKTECLYIATKFSDEACAKLVLLWGR